MKSALFSGLVSLAVIALILIWQSRDRSAPVAPQTSITDAGTQRLDEPGNPGGTVEAALSEPRAYGNGAGRARSAEQLAREVFDSSIVKQVQEFRANLQSFVREAELLPAQDHEPRARELLAEVDSLRAAGYLTGPEALALQLSLLRYALPPDEYRAMASKLVDDARQLAEQAEREWATRADARLEYYRTEERRIVEQSATMVEFPDGMTRQAYLQKSLMALRSEIFSE